LIVQQMNANTIGLAAKPDCKDAPGTVEAFGPLRAARMVGAMQNENPGHSR
jgi:hypothetical protein